MKFNSTFGPALVFLCCYLNGCLAHNIYLTYYDYRKSYEKRIRIYRISALILSGIIYLVTLVNLDFNNYYNTKIVKNYVPNDFENKFDLNKENNSDTTLLKTFSKKNILYIALEMKKNLVCFQESFILIYYLISFLILLYISHHLYYIINKDHDYIGFAQGTIYFKFFFNN